MKRTSLTVGPLAVNCYLVADENGNAAVIDPGDEASRILEALQREGMTCKAVLLTHVHFDHIGAVKELCEATGAPLYCHEDDVAALLADPDKADSLLDLISALLDSEEEQTAGSNQSGGSSRRAKIRKGLQMLKTAAQKALQSKAVERLRNRVGSGKIVDRVKNRISNLKEKVKNLSKNEKVQDLTRDVLEAIVENLLPE